MTSETNRQLFLIKDLERGSLGLSGSRKQRCSRHYDGELRHKLTVSFDATVNSDAPAAGGFDLPYGCIEVFRHSHTVEHQPHNTDPRSHLRPEPAMICAHVESELFGFYVKTVLFRMRNRLFRQLSSILAGLSHLIYFPLDGICEHLRHNQKFNLCAIKRSG